MVPRLGVIHCALEEWPGERGGAALQEDGGGAPDFLDDPGAGEPGVCEEGVEGGPVGGVFICEEFPLMGVCGGAGGEGCYSEVILGSALSGEGFVVGAAEDVAIYR